MEQIELEALKSEAEAMVKICESNLEELKRENKRDHEDHLRLNKGMNKTERARTVKENYEEFRERCKRVLAEEPIESNMLPNKIDNQGRSLHRDPASFFQEVKLNSQRIKSIVSELKELKLPEDKEEELIDSEKEIEKVVRPKLPLYAEELSKSLNEFRSGHLLASSMIAGRIIDVALDKIGSKIDSNQTEDKIEYLQENDITYESTDGNIVSAIKSYRNIYSHEIGKYPSIDESLIIFSGTSHLLKKIIENEMVGELDLA